MTYSTSNALLANLVYDKARVNQQAVDNATYTLADGTQWTLKYFGSDPNGYQGGVFVNAQTNAIVVVNRGTELLSLGDLSADMDIGIGQVPGQFNAAEETYLQAKKIAAELEVPVPVSSIVITGHSLGGALTQLVAAKYAADGISAETFNAYGAGNLLPSLGISGGSFSNIVNRVIEHDTVSKLTESRMVGVTYSYAAPSDPLLETAYGRMLMGLPGKYLQYGFASHSIDLFGLASVRAQTGRQITEQTPRVNYTITPFGLPWLVATAFAQATTIAPARRDPLILDLDGNGLDTTGIDSSNPILFDHDADGIKTATGWIQASDAFLVLDRNGNGTIDNGRELFGDATPLSAGGLAADGFAALAQEDSNLDGRVDALDDHFASLRLWTDLNQDGLSQNNELFTLEQKGIAALIVAKTENAVILANGNQIADLGGYLRSDGSSGTLAAAEQLADVDLASNPFYSEFTDSIPLTEAAQSLPDMNGAGQVRGLQQAASLPTPEGQALADQLAAFAADTTRAGQRARLDSLLKAWAATSTMATTASGAFAGVNLSLSFAEVGAGTTAYQAWLDKLTILECFNGQTFLPVPAAGTTLSINFYDTREALLNQAYASLKDSVYGALDFTQVRADFTAMIDADAFNSMADLLNFNSSAGGMLAGTGIRVKGTAGWSNKSRRWRDGDVVCANDEGRMAA